MSSIKQIDKNIPSNYSENNYNKNNYNHSGMNILGADLTTNVSENLTETPTEGFQDPPKIAKGSYASSIPELFDKYILSKKIIPYSNFIKLVFVFVAFFIFHDFTKGFFYEKEQVQKCIIQYIYLIICLNIIWFFNLTLLYFHGKFKNIP